MRLRRLVGKEVGATKDVLCRTQPLVVPARRVADLVRAKVEVKVAALNAAGKQVSARTHTCSLAHSRKRSRACVLVRGLSPRAPTHPHTRELTTSPRTHTCNTKHTHTHAHTPHAHIGTGCLSRCAPAGRRSTAHAASPPLASPPPLSPMSGCRGCSPDSGGCS